MLKKKNKILQILFKNNNLIKFGIKKYKINIIMYMIIIIIVFITCIQIIKREPEETGGITQSNLGRMVGTSYALFYWKLFPIVVKPITDHVKYELHSSVIYPVENNEMFTQEYAQKLLNKLKKEKDITQVDILMGPEDVGIVFLTVLSAFIRGKFYPITISFVNLIFYIISFILFFLSFIRVKRYFLAFILPILSMYHPDIFKTVYLENISVYPLLALILITAIYVPILFNKKLQKKEYWLRIIVSILLLNFFILIRGLAFPIILSIFLSILLYNPLKVKFYKYFKYNLIRSIGVLAIFFITNEGIIFTINKCQYYSAKKLNLPLKKEDIKGRFRSHPFVHSIWCGLGDFGQDKGYQWNDRVAYAYAMSQDSVLKSGLQNPFEKQRYGTVFRKERTLGLIDYPYSDVFFDVKRYNSVLLDKIKTDIKSDPIWYLRILIKRFIKVMTNNCITWPACILFFTLVIIKRKEDIYLSYLKLFIIMSVLLSVPIFIYSKTYENYFLGTYVAFSVIVEFIILFIIKKIHFLKIKR